MWLLLFCKVLVELRNLLEAGKKDEMLTRDIPGEQASCLNSGTFPLNTRPHRIMHALFAMRVRHGRKKMRSRSSDGTEEVERPFAIGP
jgi:hypothetical protein